MVLAMAGAAVVLKGVPHTRASGASATPLWLGTVESRDANTDVRGALWYGTPWQTGIAEKMMADAMVRQSLSGIIDPITGATWAIRPGRKDDPLAREIADSVSDAFLERLPFLAILERQLRGVLRDGFELEEVTEHVDELERGRFPSHPGRGRGVFPEEPHHRPSWSLYEWIQNHQRADRIAGLSQWAAGGDVEDPGPTTIDMGQGALLMRTTYQQEGANFEGVAPLRSAYGPWKAKMLLLIVDAIRHEREGAGIPTAEQPEDVTPEELAKADEILTDLRVNERGFINAPHGWRFFFTTTTGASTGLHEAIERHNRDIMFNLGTAFLLMGTSGRSGSNALAGIHERYYSIGLEKYARLIERVWNLGLDGYSPIRRFVEQNWGTGVPMPRLTARNMPTRDWSSVLPVIHNLALSKWLTPDESSESWTREVLTMPERDPETSREVASPSAGSQQMPNEAPHGPEPTEDTEARLEELRGAYAAAMGATEERVGRLEAAVADFLARHDQQARAQLPRAGDA